MSDQKEMTKEDQAKALKKKNQAEMKAAKKTLFDYSQTKDFSKLPSDIQAAIKRVSGKRAAAGSRPSIVGTLKPMFDKVGAAVSELDIFKATKMGRGEIRKKVRETLKKAAPEERFWLEFDADSENWVFLGVGAKQPKGWLGKPID